jgi:hypothetical protein
MRDGTCHSVKRDMDHIKLIHKCVTPNKENLILLWGDSYGAVLSSGFLQLSSEYKYGFAQFTVGNAPPFLRGEGLAVNDMNIREIGERTLKAIELLKPSKVILSWMYNQKNSKNIQETINELKYTFNQIRQVSPETEIIIFGPPPHWKRSLQFAYVRYWKQFKKEMPKYSDYLLDKAFIEWDTKLKEFSKDQNVRYFSLKEALCNDKNECLTKLSASPESFSAMDWGHLTKAGSVYVVEKFFMKEDTSLNTNQQSL